MERLSHILHSFNLNTIVPFDFYAEIEKGLHWVLFPFLAYGVYKLFRIMTS